MFANKIEYFYDATGIKQKKKVTEGTVITTTDYRAERLVNSPAIYEIILKRTVPYKEYI